MFTHISLRQYVCMAALVLALPLAGAAQAFTDNTQDASTSLPVQLLRFSAQRMNGDARITWATASEKNNSHFIVERSGDGSSFSAVGRVQGRGNAATTQQYTFDDKSIPATIVYYRLQQVDTDGRTVVSQVVVLQPETSTRTAISLFPNPMVSPNLSISLQNVPTGQYTLTMRHTGGAIVYQQAWKQEGSSSTINLRLPAKPAAGIYMITISSGKNSTLHKMAVD